jgi:hypothetical protein
MKKFIFIFSGSALLLLSACTKVIDVDLNSKDPQIVIEANISDQPGPYTVNITQTVNFSETNVFPGVSGAVVTIADDLGNTETLVETSPGIYQTATTQGVPGRTYYLNVVANNETYTAQSTMPAAVSLDTLLLEESFAFGSSFYYVFPIYQDPAGKGNRYRCIQTINTRRVSEIFLFDDELSDGLVNGQPILNFSDSLGTGDSLTIELQCIDKPVYLYFFSLLQTVSGQTGAPANPVSNISNDALGYFNAHTSRKKYVIIP